MYKMKIVRGNTRKNLFKNPSVCSNFQYVVPTLNCVPFWRYEDVTQLGYKVPSNDSWWRVTYAILCTENYVIGKFSGSF